MRRLLALSGAGLAVLCLAGPALGTDGSLYRLGPETIVSHVAPDGQCSSQFSGSGFGITCPPHDPVFAGTKWQIDMRTPYGGTAIEAITFSALRYHETATSMALQVLADGALAWGVAESDIPRSPAAPKAYLVSRGGQTLSLRLLQTETRKQPNRVWAILNLAILVRDFQAPTAQLVGAPEGWIRDASTRIVWIASDNLGSDGIRGQRLLVDGRAGWSGAPGAGTHTVDLPLGDVPDGSHTLRLEVDGDGTPGAGAQAATLRIDRTAPTAQATVAYLGSDRARIGVSLSDATSGIVRWSLAPPEPGAAAIASGTAAGSSTTEVVLADYLAPGETTRLLLRAEDAAGNVRTVLTPPITRQPPGAVALPPAGTYAGPELGEPGLIEASGAPLPNFATIQSKGLRSPRARRYAQSGGQLAPIIVATWSRPMALSGRFFHRNGRGLRGATVYLLDPLRRTQATTLTDRRGRFTFRIRPTVPGTWRAVALGRPLVVGLAEVAIRPLVRVRVRGQQLRPGETLRVAGVIRPRARVAGKTVELQWRRGAEWRPLVTTRADRRGKFALRYRVSAAGGGYSVRMRVVVPREKGWPFSPVVAARFRTSIR
ncbi:MAG: hypothetical protein AB7O78_03455 [Thermoleophilia bacterium]